MTNHHHLHNEFSEEDAYSIVAHSQVVHCHLVAALVKTHECSKPRLMDSICGLRVSVVWNERSTVLIDGKAGKPYKSPLTVPSLGTRSLVYKLENLRCAAFACNIGTLIRTVWNNGHYLVTEKKVVMISPVQYEELLAQKRSSKR